MKMERLKQLIEKRKEKSRMRRDAELKSEFKVVERNSELWLTHNGVAFMKMPWDMQAHDVAYKLAKVRETAVTFDKL